MVLGNLRTKGGIIMEEVRIDVRTQSPERIEEARRSADLCFRINHTNPTTPECHELVQELFNNTMGENTVIHPPIFTILADKFLDKVFPSILFEVYANSDLSHLYSCV